MKSKSKQQQRLPPFADRMVAALLVLIRHLLLVVPPHWVSIGAAGLAALAWPWQKRDRRLIGNNIQRVYALPAGTHFSEMFARQVLRHQVRCSLETLRLIWDLSSALTSASTSVPTFVSASDMDLPWPKYARFDGYHELQQQMQALVRSGKSPIVVTAHLGSWELVAYVSRRAARKPMYVLAKPTSSSAFTAFLDSVRRKMQVEVLWTGSKTLLRDMLGVLKRSELLGFVMDQKPEGRQGPQVNFFGIPTEFVAGPAAMAGRSGAGVIAVFCVRLSPFHFRIISRTLHQPAVDALDDSLDQVALTQTMASEVERVIRLYPEQWTWNYKRWRG